MRPSFQAIYSVFKARFKVYTRYPSWFVLSFAYPIFMTLMPVFLAVSVGGSIQTASEAFNTYAGTPEFIFYILVGSTVWSISVNILWDFGMWLYEEMEAGTLEQLLLTPVLVSELLLGAVMYTLVISLITSFVGLILASALFGYIHYLLSVEFIIAIGIIVLGFIPLMGMAVFFGAIVLKIKEPWALFNFLSALLVFIAGVFYPVTVLPPLARYVAVTFPATIQICDSRAVILHIDYIFDSTIDILILASYAIFWPVFGGLMFRRVRSELKSKGSIGAH